MVRSSFSIILGPFKKREKNCDEQKNDTQFGEMWEGGSLTNKVASLHESDEIKVRMRLVDTKHA